jgi:hypothetical protein
MYITTQYQLQLIGYISELYKHITHETAIFHNLPLSSCTADRKKLDQSSKRSTFKHFMFLQKYVNQQFFCG